MLVGGQVSLTILVIVLITVSIVDLKLHKIPNVLSAFAALYGIFVHLYTGLGVFLPLAGMVLGLIIFLPFYIAGGMGAGDVKLMSAVGAILGIKVVLAAGITLIAGLFMGLFVLLNQPDGRAALKSHALIFFRFFRWGVWNPGKPPREHIVAKRFPYAIAIATGTLFTAGFIISPSP
jgi:prepilin peptidase CpaA